MHAQGISQKEFGENHVFYSKNKTYLTIHQPFFFRAQIEHWFLWDFRVEHF